MAELRWNCEKQDCYIKNARPMSHDFDGPYGTNPPRKIQVSDIDQTVEVDGYFVFVEYKSHYEMSEAQRRYYEQLSRLQGVGKENTVTVFYVVGDANQRQAEAFQECRNGKWTAWQNTNWQDMIERVQAFKDKARERHRANVIASRRPPTTPPAPEVAEVDQKSA